MSDFKSVKQLCEENPNLNNHVLSLADEIDKLEKENQNLVKRHIELENSLIELRKYHKEFEQFAATVYDPNKPSYKQLEEKLTNLEIDKNREIDELWAIKIKPLREKVEQYEKSLNLVQSMTINDSQHIRELQETIKDQQTIISYAAGYISTCEQFRDKHPNDVVKWLFEGLKDNQ